MTPPPNVTRLTPELIREHPALAAFRDYIQQHQHQAPRPEDIVVSNERPQDGIVQFSYFGPRGSVFVAQLDASQALQALQLRHGQVRGGTVVWAGSVENQNVANACQTVHALGGEEESSYHCPAITSPTGNPSPSLFSQRAVWLGQWGVANWIGAEAIGLLWKRRSLTKYTLRNLGSWLRPMGANEIGFGERVGLWSPVLAAGAITVLSAEYTASNLGLHSNYHNNERYALDVYGAYGAMYGMSNIMNRRNPGAGLRTASLGAGLLSAAIVDSTLGQMWEEGSTERRALKVGAFFLPEIYRMAFGNRSLALAETRVGSGFTRWGGRAMAAGFYADMAYMIYNHLSSDNLETGRNNLLYRRATQLQSQDQHPLAWLLHGAASVVAPSLTDRYLVGSKYVDQARRDMEAQSAATGTHAQAVIGRALLLGPNGPATDPRFYQELDWSWLRGDNTLRSVTLPGGRSLPVAEVAEQLGDPEIYRRVIENGTPEQQIAYVQRQFRGYRLSHGEVEAILSRITLHHARQELADLQYTAGPDQQALARCFDAQGSLQNGQEQNLLAQVFPGQEFSTDQILALRRVALTRRILELRNSDPSGQSTELVAYTRVARELGLVDDSGQLVSREETELAQASITSRPPAVSPANPPAPNRGQILLNIAALSQHG